MLFRLTVMSRAMRSSRQRACRRASSSSQYRLSMSTGPKDDSAPLAAAALTLAITLALTGCTTRSRSLRPHPVCNSVSTAPTLPFVPKWGNFSALQSKHQLSTQVGQWKKNRYCSKSNISLFADLAFSRLTAFRRTLPRFEPEENTGTRSFLRQAFMQMISSHDVWSAGFPGRVLLVRKDM
jgi:hypothetical protein